MIRSSLAFMLLFSIAGIAKHNPISEFPSGAYLGEGNMIASNGGETTYASFASIGGDEVSFAIVRAGQLFSYNLYFEFNDNGFFSVQANEVNKEGEEVIHYGQGYCQSVQCHFEFDLEGRKIEETITFATWENKIYTIGSMFYYDENGDEQALAWEERFLKISDDEDTTPPEEDEGNR